MTLLNFASLGSSVIPYIVDDSPLKQGLYTPGSNIPIVAAAALVAEQHSKLLILPLAWNFFGEIASRCKQLLTKGGPGAGAGSEAGRRDGSSIKTVKFVRYFPSLQIADMADLTEEELKANVQQTKAKA
jgi:hypothetical protein